MTNFDEFTNILNEVDSNTRVVLDAIGEVRLKSIYEKYMQKSTKETVEKFLCEIDKIDVEHLERHWAAFDAGESKKLTANELESFKADQDQADFYAEDKKRGIESIKKGEWAVAVFAGGSGTRFFSEWPKISEALKISSERMKTNMPSKAAPKGMFPISPVEGLCFYDLVLANLLERSMNCGKLVPLLLMTSVQTDSWTKDWANENHWNAPKEAMIIFRQGQIPRLDHDGDLIVRPDGSLFFSGNGHGGIYQALELRGENNESVIDILDKMGIEHIIMGNVDNAGLKPLDPARYGYHLRKGSDFTMSVVIRTDASEKVGVACRRKDEPRIEVIEYSVIDPKLSATPDPNGGLMFDAAHINTNLVRLSALHSDFPGTLYTGKPIDVDGELVDSSTYETLNQHLACMIDPDKVNVYSVSREEFFQPTKAIVGRDSVQTTFQSQVELTAGKIEKLSGEVYREEGKCFAYAEFHAAIGLDKDSLFNAGVGKGWKLNKHARFYACARHSINADSSVFSSGLTLEENSNLIIRVDEPYGKISYNPETRAISENIDSAGKVHFGKDVKVASGVTVNVDILGNGRFIVADSYAFTKDLKLSVKDGETVEL